MPTPTTKTDALGTYSCPRRRCGQPHWNAVLPRAARQATGNPVHCPRCGEVARLLAVVHQPAADQRPPCGCPPWLACPQCAPRG